MATSCAATKQFLIFCLLFASWAVSKLSIHFVSTRLFLHFIDIKLIALHNHTLHSHTFSISRPPSDLWILLLFSRFTVACNLHLNNVTSRVLLYKTQYIHTSPYTLNFAWNTTIFRIIYNTYKNRNSEPITVSNVFIYIFLSILVLLHQNNYRTFKIFLADNYNFLHFFYIIINIYHVMCARYTNISIKIEA